MGDSAFSALSPSDQKAVNLLICNRVALVGTTALAAPECASGPARDMAGLLMRGAGQPPCRTMQAMIAMTQQMIAANPDALAVARQFHQALADGAALSLEQQ